MIRIEKIQLLEISMIDMISNWTRIWHLVKTMPVTRPMIPAEDCGEDFLNCFQMNTSEGDNDDNFWDAYMIGKKYIYLMDHSLITTWEVGNLKGVMGIPVGGSHCF